MSRDMGTDEQLYAAMRRAVEAEPAMGSAPRDDLARGRRLLRRRRLGGAVAVTALVPAVALLGSGLAPGGSGSTGSGGFSDDGSEEPIPQATCATLEAWPGDGSGGPAASSGDSGHGEGVGSARTGGAAQQPGGIDPQGSVGELDPDGAVSSCDEPATYSVDTSAIDRIQEALLDRLGPQRDHVDGIISGIGTTAVAGAVVGDGGTPTEPADAPTEARVRGRWTEGTGVGAVAVSVSDGEELSGPGGDVPACADPSLAADPELTCEQQTLSDGTTVLVGRGEQDGAQRVTVRYARSDGQVVSATADQASEDWWADGSGAGPLEQPPLTVEQLIDLVRDPLMHL